MSILGAFYASHGRMETYEQTPILILQLAELFSFSWTLGMFLCKFVNYMQNVSAVASVLNLTVMSLER